MAIGKFREELSEHHLHQNGSRKRQLCVIASFSRALVEGLTAQQSDAEFDKALDATIQSIYDASIK